MRTPITTAARLLQPLGQNESALESYDKAIQLNPNHAQAYNNKGSALHALLQYEAALAML